jgi:hypothetical protein
MNIAPTAVPTAVLTPEAPRPLQPPTHESSRPIIAPNRSEATAQETRREDTPHVAERPIERKIEHEPQERSPQTHRGSADSPASHVEPTTAADNRAEANGSHAVGALLDVFV